MPIWWQDKTAITGIGHTEYGRGLRRSETDLATEAITGAVADAGLEPADIDGLATFSTQSEGTNNYIRQAMPVGNARYYVSVPHGGGGYPAVVANGAMGVAAGQCRHLVAYRAGARGKGSARGEGYRAGGRPWERAGERIVDTSQYQVPFGVMSPVQAVAIIAQRYIHNFGAAETGFADVAVAARKHAARNPNAVLREPITSEDHHRSRMVADPLRLLDCCLETDGAAAVVISGVDDARNMPHTPALLHAFAQSVSPAHYNLTEWWRSDRDGLATGVGRRLFEQSEFKWPDIDAAMLFDHFTPMVLLALEDLGFCGRGEGSAFARDGGLEWPSGRLPVNTHGGQLSEAFVHGFNNILEAVRQVRGTSTAQVVGAEAVTVAGSVSGPSSAMILRKG